MGVTMHHDNIDRALMLAGRRWADEVGYAVTNKAKELIVERGHVDEGRMLGSIEHSVVDVTPRGARVVVGSSVDYTRYFETGTGVHGPNATPIVPVTKKVLKFQVRDDKGSTPKERGAWVFARSVQGMESSPFMSDALEAVLGPGGNIRRAIT